MATATFGPFIVAPDVDDGIIVFIKKWLPTYLRAAEIRRNKPTRTYMRPTTYTTVYPEDDEDFYSDRKMPTVIVSAGEAEGWQKTGSGLWSATFRTTVSVVGRGKSQPNAKELGAVWIGAVSELMLSRASLDAICGGVHPVSERVRPVTDPSNRSRHLVAGVGVYDLFIPNIRQSMEGPRLPDPQDDPDVPYEPYPEATEVTVVVDGAPPPTWSGS